MILGVHSSLSSLGNIDNKAETVLCALKESVGSSGTIMMPSHNNPVNIWYQSAIPSKSGYLTEYFRAQTGTKRSLHPTHSCVASGPLAEYILEGHPESGAEGESSPFHRLAVAGGYILMIGVKYNKCTLIHVAEELEKREYLKYACRKSYDRNYILITESGKEINYKPYTFPGCSNNFKLIEEELEHLGLIKKSNIGKARSTLAKGTDILEVACKFLKKHKEMFLCNLPECKDCARVRTLMI